MSDSIESSSSWLIEDILRKLYATKQNKVTEQILRNLAIGVKSQFSSHFRSLWDQWKPNQKKKKNLDLPIEQSLQI